MRSTEPSSSSQQALLSQTPHIPIPSHGSAPSLLTCWGWHAGGVQEACRSRRSVPLQHQQPGDSEQQQGNLMVPE